MQVRVKLMGLLKAKTPPGGQLDLPDGATVEAALRALDIPGEHIQLVMVNNQPEPDRSRALADDDELLVLAPVAGG